MAEPDQWRKVTPPVDVGFQFDYYVCRYCNAQVTNELGEWYTKYWDDEFGKRSSPVRDRTPRWAWHADHAEWCIVPKLIEVQ